MRPASVAALCVAIVLAFAAIAISVVQEREGLTTQVTTSFALSLIGPGLVPRDTWVTCRKQSVDFYRCQIVSRGLGGNVPPRMKEYRLGLRDDGCWTVLRGPPARIRPPRKGCIGRRD